MCNCGFCIYDITICSSHWQSLSALALHFHVHHQELSLHLVKPSFLVFRFGLFRSTLCTFSFGATWGQSQRILHLVVSSCIKEIRCSILIVANCCIILHSGLAIVSTRLQERRVSMSTFKRILSRTVFVDHGVIGLVYIFHRGSHGFTLKSCCIIGNFLVGLL